MVQTLNNQIKTLNLDAVQITGVTSPAAIMNVAKQKGLNPQNVYVRVTFIYNNQECVASNQLRFFGEEGYNQLLDAVKNKVPTNITLSINDKYLNRSNGNGVLIYLNNTVEVSELFKDSVVQPKKENKICKALGL